MFFYDLKSFVFFIIFFLCYFVVFVFTDTTCTLAPFAQQIAKRARNAFSATVVPSGSTGRVPTSHRRCLSRWARPAIHGTAWHSPGRGQLI